MTGRRKREKAKGKQKTRFSRTGLQFPREEYIDLSIRATTSLM